MSSYVNESQPLVGASALSPGGKVRVLQVRRSRGGLGRSDTFCSLFVGDFFFFLVLKIQDRLLEYVPFQASVNSVQRFRERVQRGILPTQHTSTSCVKLPPAGSIWSKTLKKKEKKTQRSVSYVG